MRHIEPDPPLTPMEFAASREQERLRLENQDLKRQVQELKAREPGPARAFSAPDSRPRGLWKPSGITIPSTMLALTVLVAGGFFPRLRPRPQRRAVIFH